MRAEKDQVVKQKLRVGGSNPSSSLLSSVTLHKSLSSRNKEFKENKIFLMDLPERQTCLPICSHGLGIPFAHGQFYVPTRVGCSACHPVKHRSRCCREGVL